MKMNLRLYKHPVNERQKISLITNLLQKNTRNRSKVLGTYGCIFAKFSNKESDYKMVFNK